MSKKLSLEIKNYNQFINLLATLKREQINQNSIILEFDVHTDELLIRATNALRSIIIQNSLLISELFNVKDQSILDSLKKNIDIFMVGVYELDKLIEILQFAGNGDIIAFEFDENLVSIPKMDKKIYEANSISLAAKDNINFRIACSTVKKLVIIKEENIKLLTESDYDFEFKISKDVLTRIKKLSTIDKESENLKISVVEGQLEFISEIWRLNCNCELTQLGDNESLDVFIAKNSLSVLNADEVDVKMSYDKLMLMVPDNKNYFAFISTKED